MTFWEFVMACRDVILWTLALALIAVLSAYAILDLLEGAL